MSLVILLQNIFFPLRLHYCSRRIKYDSIRRIVQISPSTLVKGPCSSAEIEAHSFASQLFPDFVPRLQRIYHYKGDVYIAMEFISGTTLDTVWDKISDRNDVVARVMECVERMHACEPPSELDCVVGSIQGGKVFDGALGQRGIGPFRTLEEFERISWNVEAEVEREPKQIGFVHADLAPRNIIVAKGNGKVYIIDWEFAGWWPIYWERVKWHFADFPPLPGWVEVMDEASRRDALAV